MKKLIKMALAVSLMTVVFVGCGTTGTDNTSNNVEVENINNNSIEKNNTDIESFNLPNVYIAETENNKGMFWFDMSTDEALDALEENGISIESDITERGYEVDDRSVLVFNDEFNLDRGIYYAIYANGDIELYFDKDDKLVELVVREPIFETNEDTIVRKGYKTEKGIRMTDTADEFIENYGKSNDIQADIDNYYQLDNGTYMCVRLLKTETVNSINAIAYAKTKEQLVY